MTTQQQSTTDKVPMTTTEKVPMTTTVKDIAQDTTTPDKVVEGPGIVKQDNMNKHQMEEDEDQDDLKSKYHKLVEHNSKLVDLLKTTMQIQTDMFRKLLKYVFP